MDFSIRSAGKELLDAEHLPQADLWQNLRELDTINRLLGGHRVTIKGMATLSGDLKELHVCEIGSGGGDNLRALRHWGARQGKRIRTTGIDLKDDCILYARKQAPDSPDTQWICADYRHARLDPVPDIVFCSLFCHHFQQAELEEMMRWMSVNSRIGFFINDLHRHPFAYYSILALTRAFSKSYLVKHDAPLSVLRGFRRTELEEPARRLEHLSPGFTWTNQWEWAFRWLFIAKNQQVP